MAELQSAPGLIRTCGRETRPGKICPSSPHVKSIRVWPDAWKRSLPRDSAAEALSCGTGVLLAEVCGRPPVGVTSGMADGH